MSEMEQRLNALLSNPQLMQQIASMAQAMGSEQQNKPPEQPEAPLPSFDPKLLQTMAQTMGQSGIDSNQKSLLQALSPYLSSQRVRKLERAMRAAKMARFATGFLGQQGLLRLGR